MDDWEVSRRENDDAPCGYEYVLHYEFDAGRAGGISIALLLALETIRAEEDRDSDLWATKPLSNIVDPEALDGLFRPVKWRTDRQQGHVYFPYDGFAIRVHADGEIIIRPSADG